MEPQAVAFFVERKSDAGYATAMPAPNCTYRLNFPIAQAIYAILVTHLGVTNTPEAETAFCREVAHRKRFNLRSLGFEGDFWNEGGTPFPRVTCPGHVPYETVDATVQANGAIARMLVKLMQEEAA